MIDSWKKFKGRHKFGRLIQSVIQFGDITTRDILYAADTITDTKGTSLILNKVSEGSSPSPSMTEYSISSVSFQDQQIEHTQFFTWVQHKADAFGAAG